MNKHTIALLILAYSTSFAALADDSTSKWDPFVSIGLQSGNVLSTPESVRLKDTISPLLSIGTSYRWLSTADVEMTTTLSAGYRAIDYSQQYFPDDVSLSHWNNFQTTNSWETWLDQKIMFKTQSKISPFVSVGVGEIYTSSDVIEDAPYVRFESGLNFKIEPKSSFALSLGHYDKL